MTDLDLIERSDGGLWDFFRAMGEVREARGFVWVGTQEADPRAVGGDTLMWGRSPDNTLHVHVIREEGWAEIGEDEWLARWPHSHVPPRLPDKQPDAEGCPTCGSPSPDRHPAVAFEGEVQPCRDDWHMRWMHHEGEAEYRARMAKLRKMRDLTPGQAKADK